MTDYLLDRGVYRAPVLGCHGEIILYAVDSQHREIDHGRTYLTSEAEVQTVNAALWRMLDVVDPQDIIPLRPAIQLAG